MTQVKVFTKEDSEFGYNGTILTHLRPRRNHTSYSFQDMMKYAKEELFWADISEEEVVGFEIFNKSEHWTTYIEKESE